MTSTITQALILHGPFGSNTRHEPIWDFLEHNNLWFDSREHDASSSANFMTEDFTFRSPHADYYSYANDSNGNKEFDDDHAFMRAVQHLWTVPLREHKHVTQLQIAIESKDGYDVYGQYACFVNVAGEPAEGEKKVKDDEGTEWDAEMPAFYHFDVVKDGKGKRGGFRIRHISMIKDTGVINDKLDARGLGHKRSLNYETD